MRNLNKDFENTNIDYNKLLEYGFNKKDNTYFFEKIICDNRFKVVIEISKENKTSKVIDISLNEEYSLVDVKDSIGEFIGKVKEAYEDILNDLIKKCTTPNIFKNKQSKEIIKYIKEKYNDELEYLWEKFPNNAVWRNKKNNKWYGALLIITKNKLGIDSDEIIEIVDLRYQKNNIKDIIDNKKIYAGYHMNKENWITIILNDSIDTKKIYSLIDNSYNLSLEK